MGYHTLTIFRKFHGTINHISNENQSTRIDCDSRHMKRLFLAIDLPERIVDNITATYMAIPGARWVHEKQLHLTLRFFGELPGDREERLIKTLASVTLPSFSLRVKGTGHFPPRGEPKALWLGVTPQDELSRLASSVESSVVSAGFNREPRKFKGHITVARCRSASSERVAQYIAANSLFTSEPFTVSAFHLYASHLGKNHATYTREVTFPLGETGLLM